LERHRGRAVGLNELRQRRQFVNSLASGRNELEHADRNASQRQRNRACQRADLPQPPLKGNVLKRAHVQPPPHNVHGVTARRVARPIGNRPVVGKSSGSRLRIVALCRSHRSTCASPPPHFGAFTLGPSYCFVAVVEPADQRHPNSGKRSVPLSPLANAFRPARPGKALTIFAAVCRIQSEPSPRRKC